MTVRSRARSLAAPSTFIETSHAPMPSPKIASPVTTSALVVMVAPTPVKIIPKPIAMRHVLIVAAEPIRASR